MTSFTSGTDPHSYTLLRMKYLFITLLFFTYGYFLPSMSSGFQIFGSFLGLVALVIGIVYYIDTRVNAIRY